MIKSKAALSPTFSPDRPVLIARLSDLFLALEARWFMRAESHAHSDLCKFYDVYRALGFLLHLVANREKR